MHGIPLPIVVATISFGCSLNVYNGPVVWPTNNRHPHSEFHLGLFEGSRARDVFTLWTV